MNTQASCSKCNRIVNWIDKRIFDAFGNPHFHIQCENGHGVEFCIPATQQAHITVTTDVIDPDTGVTMLQSGDSINQEVYDWLSFKPEFDALDYQIAPV